MASRSIPFADWTTATDGRKYRHYLNVKTLSSVGLRTNASRAFRLGEPPCTSNRSGKQRRCWASVPPHVWHGLDIVATLARAGQLSFDGDTTGRGATRGHAGFRDSLASH